MSMSSSSLHTKDGSPVMIEALGRVDPNTLMSYGIENVLKFHIYGTKKIRFFHAGNWLFMTALEIYCFFRNGKSTKDVLGIHRKVRVLPWFSCDSRPLRSR